MSTDDIILAGSSSGSNLNGGGQFSRRDGLDDEVNALTSRDVQRVRK